MLTKKILSILAISILIAALAGCGGGGGGDVTGVSSSGSAAGSGGTGGTGGSGGTVSGTLSWAAPTTYTNGSTLTNLAGFKVYYGTQSGNYTGSINVVGKNSTSLPVATLASSVPSPGTYHVSVTAYDVSGMESDYSNEVSITL